MVRRENERGVKLQDDSESRWEMKHVLYVDDTVFIVEFRDDLHHIVVGFEKVTHILKKKTNEALKLDYISSEREDFEVLLYKNYIL